MAFKSSNDTDSKCGTCTSLASDSNSFDFADAGTLDFLKMQNKLKPYDYTFHLLCCCQGLYGRGRQRLFEVEKLQHFQILHFGELGIGVVTQVEGI